MKRVIWLLILSDILILSGFGLIAPIMAIFLKEEIVGGSVVAAGISSMIFLLVKGVVQLPTSFYIDSKRKKLGFLIVGTFLVACVPFIYAFAPSVNYIFLGQVVYGIGAALAFPTWHTIFIMNMNRKHRGFEWALWSTSVGIFTGAAAYTGARLVDIVGFRFLFFIVGILSVCGMLVLFFISRKNLRKVNKVTHKYFSIPFLRPKHSVDHGKV